jgi:hypothetical protein
MDDVATIHVKVVADDYAFGVISEAISQAVAQLPPNLATDLRIDPVARIATKPTVTPASDRLRKLEVHLANALLDSVRDRERIAHLERCVSAFTGVEIGGPE